MINNQDQSVEQFVICSKHPFLNKKKDKNKYKFII